MFANVKFFQTIDNIGALKEEFYFKLYPAFRKRTESFSKYYKVQLN